jgi:alpha-tubulin suppressor-like RCC1 family protein
MTRILVMCVLFAAGTAIAYGETAPSAGGRHGEAHALADMTEARAWQTTSSQILSVSGGGAHTCAVPANRLVYCWGMNIYGQLGIGTWISSNIPITVPAIAAVSVASGDSHTCALTTGDTVMCWGNNMSGQLGDGTTISSTLPVAVVGLTGTVRAIASGQGASCAILNDGHLQCWGLGKSTAALVAGIADVVAVSIGNWHTCAVTGSGVVKCWGYNASGQLGIGTFVNTYTPTDVVGIANVVAIGAGDHHTCAIVSGGAVKCWGKNAKKQLGNGGTVDSNVPVSVIGVDDAVDLGMGATVSCAALQDGSVKCWGYDGIFQGAETAGALDVAVTSISDGSYHRCVTPIQGGLKCWGYNSAGHLGNGKWENTKFAQDVVGPLALPPKKVHVPAMWR